MSSGLDVSGRLLLVFWAIFSFTEVISVTISCSLTYSAGTKFAYLF